MSYDKLMRELSRAVAEQHAARAEATRRHDSEQAAVAAELRQAQTAAAAARRRRRAADELFDRVQNESARQWQRLRDRLPRRQARRMGVLPRPAEPSRAQIMSEHPAEGSSELIAEARELLDQAHRRPALTGGAYAILVLVGVVCAAAAALLARGFLLAGRNLAGPVGTVLVTVGQIGMFVAPLGGLPAMKWFVDRAGSRVDGGAVAVVVVAGLLTVAAFALLLPS
jgi:hypothetical protein